MVCSRNVFTSFAGRLSYRAHKARTFGWDAADGLFAESGAVSGQVAAGAEINETRLAAWRRADLRFAVLRGRYAVFELNGSGKMSRSNDETGKADAGDKDETGGRPTDSMRM